MPIPPQWIDAGEVALDDLVAYDANPATHDDAQLDALAASIREHGFTTPVLLDRHGVLIAGHGRKEAARRAGLTAVPARLCPAELTPAQVRAIRVADNALARRSGWDATLLAAEVAAVREAGLDLACTGLEPAFLAALEADNREAIAAARADVDAAMGRERAAGGGAGAVGAPEVPWVQSTDLNDRSAGRMNRDESKRDVVSVGQFIAAVDRDLATRARDVLQRCPDGSAAAEWLCNLVLATKPPW